MSSKTQWLVTALSLLVFFLLQMDSVQMGGPHMSPPPHTNTTFTHKHPVSFGSQSLLLSREMAQKLVSLDQEAFSCVICLDLLKDPATLPCGHNYCMRCVQNHWDREEERKIYSCPQCRQRFAPRPVLVKNTMLADLVEQMKKSGLQADPVSAAAKRAQRQMELEARQDQVLHKIQDKETDLERLQQEVIDLRHSADEAVRHSEESFFKLICLIEKSRSEVEKQIHSQLKTEEARIKQLQDQLQQDITELRQTQAQLEALALTPDHNQFLHNYPPPSSAETSPRIQPLGSFEQMTAVVSALTDLLQLTLRDGLDNISLTLSQEQPWPQTSLPEPEPTTRKDFLKYSRKVTLDTNTAHMCLSLSKGNKRVTFVDRNQKYPDHPDRFSKYKQVLSREALTGRCYWEVEWSAKEILIAVAYNNIKRNGGCELGFSDNSWALYCDKNSCSFYFNKVQSQVSGPVSSRIGVYLDHSAGVLSFYSITQTMSLLHRVQTTFTQPLYTGIGIYWFRDTALFPKLK